MGPHLISMRRDSFPIRLHGTGVYRDVRIKGDAARGFSRADIRAVLCFSNHARDWRVVGADLAARGSDGSVRRRNPEDYPQRNDARGGRSGCRADPFASLSTARTIQAHDGEDHGSGAHAVADRMISYSLASRELGPLSVEAPRAITGLRLARPRLQTRAT